MILYCRQFDFLRESRTADPFDYSGYFYHSDHLGSSSWITDEDGRAIQYLDYLPFGEPWVKERAVYSYWETPYTFSGKERDEETGYSYFGARYYDSDLSIWLSVDPLAHKFPHQSPYVYCSNNPINRIDPNGEDDFTINRKGEINLHKKTNSETDQLIALNRKGEIKLNKDGTPKRSIEVSKGVLQGGEDSRKESPNGYTKMELSDTKEAWKVFSFASRNTDVEFSLMGVKSGGEENHLITTSHDKGFDNYGPTEAGKYANNGGLLYHFHNHFNSFSPSDYGSQGGDIPFMKRMTAPGKSPDAKFGIFYGGKLFDYNGDRIRRDGSKIQ